MENTEKRVKWGRFKLRGFSKCLIAMAVCNMVIGVFMICSKDHVGDWVHSAVKWKKWGNNGMYLRRPVPEGGFRNKHDRNL